MMLKEVSHAMPALCALVLTNIAAGTVNSLAIDKFKFDKLKMIQGIIKAIVAIGGVFAIAYAFDTVDLSGVGFTPMTIVSGGIVVYGYKAGQNLVKLWGLTKRIHIPEPPATNLPIDDENK